MCSKEDRGAGGGTTIDELEREITELASHIHAAMCRWLCLVAEFDRRNGWAAWSCRSCADWVSWRCGIAPVAAREHVRVARRLDGLPLIRDAFAAGELSYSKVRALCRVGEVAREDDLLELARHATAAQLERLVRGYRGVAAVEEAARGERPSERWVTWSHDDDGSLLLSARLPGDEGALILAALDAARDGLAARVDDSAESFVGASRDPAAGDSAESGFEADRHMAMGDSAESPRSDGDLRADALLLVADSYLARGDERVRTGGDRYQVVIHLDAATLCGDGRGERCELDDGVPLAADTARRLACDAAVVSLIERDGKPLSVGRKTRSIPPALRRALAARDRGCRFPGCGARRFVDAHHIEHWAHGGATELSNLVQLCRHHHRLLHEGGYSIRPYADGRLTFHRRDGRRIEPCPANPRGRPGALRRPGDRSRPIRPDACAPIGDQKLDLALGVDAILAFAPLPTGGPTPPVTPFEPADHGPAVGAATEP